MIRRTHCKHGHPWSPENTLRVGPDGRYRTCRMCASIRGRRKYRHDDEHREQMKTASLARYYTRKEEKQHALEDSPTAHVFSQDQGIPAHHGVHPDYDGDWSGCYRRAGMDSGA